MNGEQARYLRERLQDARLAPRFCVELSVLDHTWHLTANRDGEPLERLADALFRPAIEGALARYLRWLGILARQPETFPEEQFALKETTE